MSRGSEESFGEELLSPSPSKKRHGGIMVEHPKGIWGVSSSRAQPCCTIPPTRGDTTLARALFGHQWGLLG